jgi:hypothetical protein
MRLHRLLRPAAAAVVVVGVAGICAAAAAAAPPSNTSRPTISGSAQQGATLTASEGTWTNSPTSFSYIWMRCSSDGGNCRSIRGATGKRYTATSGDVGHRIRVQVTATNSSGSTKATSRATDVVRAGGSQPHNTSAPAISGNAQAGQTLSASTGGWTGTSPISYAYQWSRCDSAGANCAAIAGATGQSYNVTDADVLHTMRVTVKASNRVGSASATSGQTALVAPSKAGGAGIPVATVSLPDRLVVDKVKFSPQPLGSRRPLVGRFHVSDTRGFSVQGALVFAIGLPYGWTRSSAEVPTDGDGWATVTFMPTQKLPLRHGTFLVSFVRARKPGDSVLAGVSSRRLVQARIR